MEVYTKEEYEQMQRNAYNVDEEPARAKKSPAKDILKAVLLIMLFMLFFKAGFGFLMIILFLSVISMIFTFIARLFGFWLWW